MSSIGPQLPPHLCKRKRSSSDITSPPPSKSTRPSNADDSDSDDGYGPSAPKAVAGPILPPSATISRPPVGPTMPPSSTSPANKSSLDDDTGPLPPPRTTSQPQRTHGPAPPPAPLSERPLNPASASDSDDDDDDDDDDYGPLPPSAATRAPIGPSLPPPPSAAPERLQRDEWMTLPPTASTGYQERDPTKIKSRKFASGMTATTRPKDGSSGGGIASIWTETPVEKAKRLADAVLGRGTGEEAQQAMSSSGGRSGVSGIGSGNGNGRDAAVAAREERIRAAMEQTRGRSLVEEHQAAKKAGARKAGKAEDEEEDDPSKRAFDREKDMAVGGKISATQRKELLNRAQDFGGRFSKGNYL